MILAPEISEKISQKVAKTYSKNGKFGENGNFRKKVGQNQQ